MKFSQFPVYLSDPADIVFNRHTHCSTPLDMALSNISCLYEVIHRILRRMIG
jgi:hypothetical protein